MRKRKKVLQYRKMSPKMPPQPVLNDQEAVFAFQQLFGPVEQKKPSDDAGDSLEVIQAGQKGTIVQHWRYRHHWDDGHVVKRVLFANGWVYENYCKIAQYDMDTVRRGAAQDAEDC